MKIGLITYHSAYNFGSVLQAYATEVILEHLGYKVSVINYRIPFQTKYYGPLGYGKGLKAPLKKAMMLPSLPERKKRSERYESFIRHNMKLTALITDPKEAKQFKEVFDVYISGSDQIWNIHSNEFIHSGIEYMNPYLLTFTDKKKISYASSIVNMSDNELCGIIPELKRFSHISCREPSAAERIGSLLEKEVDYVCDPTLLLTGEEWKDILVQYAYRPYTEKKYALYYSLKNYAETKHDLERFASFAKRKNLLIVALTPLIPVIKMRNVINAVDAGPIEFLNLIRGAECIFTDSYHGTLFSINFERPFFYIKNPGGDHGARASEIFALLDIKDRMIETIGNQDIDKQIDYQAVNEKLDELREHSIDYLRNAIED